MINIFETYPGIKKFLDDAVAHAKEEEVCNDARAPQMNGTASSNFMRRNFTGESGDECPDPGDNCRYYENRNEWYQQAFKERADEVTDCHFRCTMSFSLEAKIETRKCRGKS